MPVGIDEKFFGYDGFIWFFGVVEDIEDPEQVSRVRVRVLGHHSSDKKIVKTENLPWAQVMMPTTSASVSGIGISPHGMVNGSYVFGFFLDGEQAQQPMVVGTWHGIPQELPDPEKGFNDPNGEYPFRVDVPDTAEEARGVNTIGDIIDTAINNPPSAFGAVYPHNKVIKTTSGHILELDDTPNAERIRIYHKSGTMEEIHPNGDKVEIRSNSWQMTYGDNKARVSGDLELYVDGNAKIEVAQYADIRVEESATVVTGVDLEAIVGKDMFVDVGGNVTSTVKGNVEATVKGNTQLTVEGNVTETVYGNVNQHILGAATIKIDNSATVNVPTTNWTGNINLTGDITQTGNINLTGTSTASGDHVSAGISGKGHTHTISGGSSAGTTTGPS
jgi:hypothetical protein